MAQLGLAAQTARTYAQFARSEEHTSELQSRLHLVCRLLLEKKKKHTHRPRRAIPPTSLPRPPSRCSHYASTIPACRGTTASSARIQCISSRGSMSQYHAVV